MSREEAVDRMSQCNKIRIRSRGKTTKPRQVGCLDFNFLSDFENGAETAGGTSEPAEEGPSTLKPPSAFMETDRNLPESSSPGNSKNVEKKLLMESRGEEE